LFVNHKKLTYLYDVRCQAQAYYEIKRVYDCKRAGKGFRYKVEWVGEGEGNEDTWQLKQTLTAPASETNLRIDKSPSPSFCIKI